LHDIAATIAGNQTLRQFFCRHADWPVVDGLTVSASGFPIAEIVQKGDADMEIGAPLQRVDQIAEC
jgi:hypothetical protein